MNYTKCTTSGRLIFVVLFSFLTVVGSESVAVGNLLVAPKGAAKIIDAGSPGSFTSRQLGEAISASPQASQAYQRLQQMGFDVRIVNRADGLAGETSLRGVVNINRRYNGSVQEALETLVHESKHVDLLRTTGDLNV